jgi:hypothetical protein
MSSAKISVVLQEKKEKKIHISVKQMSIIVKFWIFLQFLFKCITICLNAFFQTKPKIIANVLQHIYIYLNSFKLSGILLPVIYFSFTLYNKCNR